MITLTRLQARRLRGVFRRSVLGIAHRGTIPPLILHTEGMHLRAQYRYDTLAVEHVEPGPERPTEAIALPLDALAEFEGRDETPVVIEAVAPDKTILRWNDRGIPQTREFEVTALESQDPFSQPPASWSNAPAGLLDALAEATAIACDGSARYALGCVLLKGSRGEIVATDGQQLLVQGGFKLPWPDDILVRRSPIFASKSLPRDRPLEVGKTETCVALRVGPWTLFLEVPKGARFPRVEDAVPGPGMASTRLRLDPDDVQFLLPALDRLPGRGELNSPATLDLNGQVAVRARAADQAAVTELVLTRSAYTGDPIRVQTNRMFLSRALRLGFTEFAISTPESPLVCRDAVRTYAWQPLSKDSAIEPSDDATRIESINHDHPTPVHEDQPTKTRTTLTEPRLSNDRITHNGDTPDHAAPAENPAAVNGLAALIQEAEALHEALADARVRTGRLVVALRRHRKRERLVTSTLATLRELKLPEAVG
jgi:hypothetical protein